MSLTLDKPTLGELRERAVALGVEANKAHRAGAHAAPVIKMSFDAIEAAQRVGGSSNDIADQIDLRYAAYLLNIHTQPGFEETCAFDGDLLYPENVFGEKVDLSGMTQLPAPRRLVAVTVSFVAALGGTTAGTIAAGAPGAVTTAGAIAVLGAAVAAGAVRLGKTPASAPQEATR